MVTFEEIEAARERLIGCPFCGRKPTIGVLDDEGNDHDWEADEYLRNPWSGLTFGLYHDADCIIRVQKDDLMTMGRRLYSTLDELIADWNTRTSNAAADELKRIREVIAEERAIADQMVRGEKVARMYTLHDCGVQRRALLDRIELANTKRQEKTK